MIILKRIRYPRNKLKFNQPACHVKMYSLTFEKPVLISGLNGVISIELNIDWTDVSFGLMFIKTKYQNDNSLKKCFLIFSY